MDYTVAQILKSEEKKYPNMEISTEFRQSLAELAFQYARRMGSDLEAFAKHARRTNINKDDVLMLVRRNDHLHETLVEKCDQLQQEQGQKKTNR